MAFGATPEKPGSGLIQSTAPTFLRSGQKKWPTNFPQLRYGLLDMIRAQRNGLAKTCLCWIEQIAFLDLLDANDIGSRPVVFITHSLGGLLAKAIVRASLDTPAEHDKHSLHRNTRGFVFFSTPHTGSSIANLASCIPGSRPTTILTELARNDAYLRAISQWFSDKAKQFDYKCVTYFEAYKTRGLTVVDAVSANPNHGMRPVPFDGDHFSICTIPDPSDQRYKQVLKFVGKIVKGCKSPEEATQEQISIDGVDFEIGVLPNPPQDGRVIEHHPPSRTLTYTSRASRESITIFPRCAISKWSRKAQFSIPQSTFGTPSSVSFQRSM